MLSKHFSFYIMGRCNQYGKINDFCPLNLLINLLIEWGGNKENQELIYIL